MKECLRLFKKVSRLKSEEKWALEEGRAKTITDKYAGASKFKHLVRGQVCARFLTMVCICPCTSASLTMYAQLRGMRTLPKCLSNLMVARFALYERARFFAYTIMRD